MLPGASGLFTFKHNRLINSDGLQPPLFGDFHVWVLERWAFAPADASSEPTDYVNSGRIREEDLEDFLKVTHNNIPDSIISEGSD
jgi:hypothetical protein